MPRFASLLALAILLAPVAAAKVERERIVDEAGEPLVVATWDDDKAMEVGAERGFLVVVERVNRTANLTVLLEVAQANASVFRVTSQPLLSPLGRGPVELPFRLHANASAEPRRYPVTLALTVVNLNATTNETVLTRAEIPMNVTLSRAPTPLGETPATLSSGERAVVAGFTGGSLLAIGAAVARARLRKS